MVEPFAAEVRSAVLGDELGRQATAASGRFTNLVAFETIASTNTEALERARAGAGEGLVVVAGVQDAGRGRLGRSWVTEPGDALLCSVLVRPGASAGPDAGFLASASVALAARDAARQRYRVTCGLKWPNDLLVGDAKVAGVLAERVEQGAFVVGIGINLRLSPRQSLVLGEGATSLGAHGEPAAATMATAASDLGLDPEVEAFLGLFLRALEARYGPLVDGDEERRRAQRALLLEAWRGASVTLGRQVRVELPGGRELVGRASALLDDGRLELTTAGSEHGPVVLSAGDVVHLRSATPGGVAAAPD